jgi:hypothetical protein
MSKTLRQTLEIRDFVSHKIRIRALPEPTIQIREIHSPIAVEKQGFFEFMI